MKIILCVFLLFCHFAHACPGTPEEALKEFHELRNQLKFKEIAECASDEAINDFAKTFERMEKDNPRLIQIREYIKIPYELYKSNKINGVDFFIKLSSMKYKQWKANPKPSKEIAVIGTYQEGEYHHVLFRFKDEGAIFPTIAPNVFTVVKEGEEWKYSEITGS